MDDVMINKAAIIERCILRIREVYNNDPSNLVDITKQDSIVLNIQRACEAAIDLAMHVIAGKFLGCSPRKLGKEDLAYTYKALITNFPNLDIC